MKRDARRVVGILHNLRDLSGARLCPQTSCRIPKPPFTVLQDRRQLLVTTDFALTLSEAIFTLPTTLPGRIPAFG
ncbi:hypothetical protein A6X21_02375 [Planctopirus hydrillae]|uniref:Uncharacterized protein n=1 Tax=Planctopirus hydrillae TaxID=1841610 RepID=A0A1C3ERY7_9PLAN|nr:hypothetical protein A6X21_02375 [Planctopirus hydrillae]